MLKSGIAFFALATPLWASDPSLVNDRRLDLIDKAYDKCIESKDQNTCSQTFYNQQDKLLNEVYHELQQKLMGTRLKRLKESQRAWVAFKTKEFEFIDGIYPLSGTMFNPMREYRKGRVLLRRTEELIFYEGLLKEFAGDYEGESNE